MFTPCSLATVAADELMDSIKKHVDQHCKGSNRTTTECDNRIQDADYPPVRKLATNSEVLEVVQALQGGRNPFPFQTLNFKFGTGQAMHSDLMHFAGWPSMTMTATWIALEDISEESGPLDYYLGSHLDDVQTMEMLGCSPGAYGCCYEANLQEYISKNGLHWRRRHMLPKKGQVVIWDSNAIHGGGVVKDSTVTRYSQVTHFLFDDDNFFFVPQLSISDKGKFHSFALKPELRPGLSADEAIGQHWNDDDPRYVGHPSAIYSQNLHDVNLRDTGVPRPGACH